MVTAPAADRISGLFHLLMGAALVAMIWWSEPALAVWSQTVLFGCAVIWFGLTSVSTGTGTNGSAEARTWPAGLSGAHHAVMAVAMIWMLIAVPSPMPTPAASADATHATMSDGAHASMSAVNVLFAVYFALATIPWFARTVGAGRRGNRWAAAGHAAMSAGMAAMLLAMA